jgi:light-regulated signal transduction histidine kinase (bacteriophytochrome)
VGDAVLLSQVWRNLIGNAIKFSRKAAEPRVEVGSEDVDGSTWYYVRDNGAGFDMAYGDKLFGTFQRLHTDAEFEGTGVGLAIVKRIVDRHGGRVRAESPAAGGAKFSFSLDTGKTANSS